MKALVLHEVNKISIDDIDIEHARKITEEEIGAEFRIRDFFSSED